MIALQDVVIRTVSLSDLDQVNVLAKLAQSGMTNLPKKKSLLKQKISEASHSFKRKKSAPDGSFYFFVMEDVTTETIIGVSGVLSKTAFKNPLYFFKLDTYTRSYEDESYLHQVLALDYYNKGPSEVCTLYLRPDSRGRGIGRFLSLHRFLFMSQFSSRFESKVIAEMRGVSSKEGRSPFYTHVGRKYFHRSFLDADQESVTDSTFIKKLGPKFPIEISALTPWVRDFIAEPHAKTAPAHALLISEGFTFANKVCLLDAGPIIEASVRKIRVVKEAKCVDKVESVDDLKLQHFPTPTWVMISNTEAKNYCAVMGVYLEGDNKVMVSSKMTTYVMNKKGKVWIAPLYGKKGKYQL